MGTGLNILMVSSEVFPYAKAGGLADVVPKLAEALDAMGHRVKIVLPRYYNIDRSQLEKHPAPLGIPLADAEYWTAVYHTHIPGTKVDVYFLDHEELYGRDGIYGVPGTPSFEDNALRFGVLCRGAFQLCKLLSWFPDILQAHDWPAAPALAYLKSLEALGPFRKTRGVFTIHNLGYQGIFPAADFAQLGFATEDLDRLGFRYHGKINFLQSALVCCDGITTVSPGYAEEILQPELGFAMDRLLKKKEDRFLGILNGMDYEIWDPRRDQQIPYRYDRKTIQNKALNKNYLQEQAGLEINGKIPLIGMVSRLVTQKGFAQLVANDGQVLREAASLPAQIVILGTGEDHIEKELVRLAEEIPSLRVYIRYNEKMSHTIEAASDFFLMPSLYEPCGLTQMYALRYGTIPIVSPTGGLKDTVVDWQTNPAEATGFYIPEPLSSDGLSSTLAAACSLYSTEPAQIRQMQERGMALRFDWPSAAARYAEFFKSLDG